MKQEVIEETMEVVDFNSDNEAEHGAEHAVNFDPSGTALAIAQQPQCSNGI